MMFIWLIKVVTTGKCVRGGVYVGLCVIRTLKYSVYACQASLFTWFQFFFFSLTGEIKLHSCSRTYFSHLCHHKGKLPNDAAINSLLWWCSYILPIADQHAGGGNNFKSPGCKTSKIYLHFSGVLLHLILFYATSFIKCRSQGCNTTSSVITVIKAPHVKPDAYAACKFADGGFIYFQENEEIESNVRCPCCVCLISLEQVWEELHI